MPAISQAVLVFSGDFSLTLFLKTINIVLLCSFCFSNTCTLYIRNMNHNSHKIFLTVFYIPDTALKLFIKLLSGLLDGEKS